MMNFPGTQQVEFEEEEVMLSVNIIKFFNYLKSPQIDVLGI